MAKIAVKADYAASAAKVWEKLGDFGGIGSWMPGVASASPPPAESPAIAQREASTPCASSQRQAATASSTAAGWRCSGARR